MCFFFRVSYIKLKSFHRHYLLHLSSSEQLFLKWNLRTAEISFLHVAREKKDQDTLHSAKESQEEKKKMQWNGGDYNWKSRYVKSRKFERQRVWSFFSSSRTPARSETCIRVHSTALMMMKLRLRLE